MVVVSLTFRLPPKFTSIPTPNPPAMTTAPLLVDVEFLMSFTFMSLVEIEDGCKLPDTVKLPPTEISPVLSSVSVCDPPATVDPPENVVSLLTLKVPLKTVSDATFKLPPTFEELVTVKSPPIDTAPMLVMVSTCVVERVVTPPTEASPVIVMESMFTPSITTSPPESVVIPLTPRAPPKLASLPTPRPPTIITAPSLGDVEFFASLIVKSPVETIVPDTAKLLPT